jgi:hypothetical protein
VIVTEEYAASLFNEALQSDIVRQMQCDMHRMPWSPSLKDDLLFQLDCLKLCVEKLHTAYVASMDAAGERLVGTSC